MLRLPLSVRSAKGHGGACLAQEHAMRQRLAKYCRPNPLVWTQPGFSVLTARTTRNGTETCSAGCERKGLAGLGI